MSIHYDDLTGLHYRRVSSVNEDSADLAVEDSL